jgi:small subunit ribosomal protein S14
LAKLAVKNRAKKRELVAKKFAARRSALKGQIADPTLPMEERLDAQRRLQALPRNASPTRLRNRCSITGRPRGTFRMFGLGRNKLREAALRGDIPGVIKASW